MSNKSTLSIRLTGLLFLLVWGDPSLGLAQESIFGKLPAWRGPYENTYSVALGDVDGDGDLDLVRGNEGQGSTLYRNTGGTFDSSPAWTGPRGITSAVALGDVDGDGDLDLVSATDTQGPAVHLNTGGTFDSSPAWTLPSGPADYVPQYTSSVALGDVDGDGDLDFVCGHDLGAALYRNTGLGTFEMEMVAWREPPAYTLDVALGDVDGDGDLDLVCLENYNPMLYLNTGGTFESVPAWGGPEFTNSITIGDVDGDGDLDIMGGRYLYRNTNGTFETSPSWTAPVLWDISSAVLGDVDEDGDLDLVCVADAARLYRNTGGTFESSPTWTAPVDDTRRLALSDVDDDGDLDLLCGTPAATLYRNMSGTFETSPAWTGPAENYTNSVALGDVDGDGDLDLVGGRWSGSLGYAMLWRNTGGKFESSPAWMNSNERSMCVRLGDVDGDGDLDLVRGNYEQGPTLYRNTGGTFESLPAWTGEKEPSYTYAAELVDVDGDGDLDLLCATYDGPKLYRNIAGTFEPSAEWISRAEGTNSLAVADIDGDGDLDILCGGPNVALYRNRGGTFESMPAWRGPFESTTSVALGDVDGDGDPDLVCGNADFPIMEATLYLNKGGTFDSPVWTALDTVGNGPFRVFPTCRVALGDMDGDGDLDLVWVTTDPGRPTVYRNTGGMFESNPAWIGDSEYTTSIALGDVDGDGKLDLVRGNNEQGATLYLSRTAWKTAGVPFLRQVSRLSSHGGVHHINFTAVDDSSDPLWIIGHYQFEGSPVWHPMTLGGSVLPSGPWTTSSEGVVHEVFWDSRAVPPDPRNVIIRLRAVTTPAGAGTAQFIPSYRVNVGPLNLSVSSLAKGNDRGEFPVGEGGRIVVSVPAWAPFQEGQIYHRAGGSAGYDSTALFREEIAPGFFALVGTIPADQVGPRGFEYWVRVRASGKTATDPSSEPELKPRSVRTKFIRLEETLPEHAARHYRMVSAPAELELEPTASLATILSDEPEFGPPDPIKWRAFRYAPADSGYLEVTSSSTDERLRPAPGRAFWLVASQPHRIDTAPVPALSVPTDSAFAVLLEPGWNQAGDPFDFPVSWSDVTWDGSPQAVEPPVAWNEEGQRYEAGDVSVLEPFSGYWIRNTTDQPVILRVRPREASSTVLKQDLAERKSNESPENWSIQVMASSGPAVDERNFAGVARSARPGTDSFDRTEPPPAPGAAVSLYFLALDGPGVTDGQSVARTVDVRPPLEELDQASRGTQWVFDVALTGMDGPREVTLTFGNQARVPSDLEVRLVDGDLGQAIDLRRQNSYRYITRPNARAGGISPARFRLMVGTAAYLDANPSVPAEPRVTRLLPNFPNPFASGTIVRFEMARPGPATVSVFDVAGRLVRTLTSQPWEAGIHELLWNGENGNGAASAAGIYFVRLITPSGAETRKVVRLSTR